jgi:hypothetical protein
VNIADRRLKNLEIIVMASSNCEGSSKQVKHEDLVLFMNSFASEFNNDNLHDRVLVFEVIEKLEGRKVRYFQPPYF